MDTTRLDALRKKYEERAARAASRLPGSPKIGRPRGPNYFNRLHPLWHTYRWMLKRCHLPTSLGFHKYGARNIQVCDAWRRDFQQFVRDVGFPPGEGYQLDRIDNDGDYKPGNVRWATITQQARNKRNTVLLTFNGRTLCAEDWGAELGIPGKLIRQRLRRGWSVEDALSTSYARGVLAEVQNG